MPNITLNLTYITSSLPSPITGSEGDVKTLTLTPETGYHLPAVIVFGAGITTKSYNKDTGVVTFTMPSSDSTITAEGLTGLNLALIGKVTFAEQQTAIKDAILNIPSSLPTRFCEYIETVSNKIIIHNHGGTTPTQEITLSGLPAVPSGGNVYLHADSSEQLEWVIGSGGTTVVANPTLSGTEENLVGLEVDGIKYALPYEATSNKVTSISASSTDTQYPSAKVTYDLLKSLARTDGLCFTAVEAGARIFYVIIGTVDVSLQTSTDGVIWTAWDGSPITLTNIGDKVYVRNTKDKLSLNRSNYVIMGLENGKISASGNIMSLLNYAPLSEYCFVDLFSNRSVLTSTPDLPATVLAKGCYRGMFAGCTNLTKSCDLPATYGVEECYNSMFASTGLTETPNISLVIAEKIACSAMFANCSSLTKVNNLLSGILKDGAFSDMFYGCSALKINNDGSSSGTLFFTCPSTFGTGAVNYMFNRTGGSFTGTPVADGKYYWYL